MKNNLFGSVSSKHIKEIQEQSKKFKSDLNYILDGLEEIIDFLTLYAENNPNMILFECVEDIKDFISILEKYKNLGIF